MKYKRVFLDSDVLIDFLSNRMPFVDDIEKILIKCVQNDFKTFVTGVIIANVYYILRKQESHFEVLEKIENIIEFIDVINIDKEVVINALKSDFNDFEDALQNFSAEKNKIDCIITRNQKDYRKSKVTTFSPAEFLAAISVNNL